MKLKRQIIREWRRKFGTKRVRTYHIETEQGLIPRHIETFVAPNRKGAPSLKAFAELQASGAGDVYDIGEACDRWLTNKAETRRRGGGRGARRRIGGLR